MVGVAVSECMEPCPELQEIRSSARKVRKMEGLAGSPLPSSGTPKHWQSPPWCGGGAWGQLWQLCGRRRALPPRQASTCPLTAVLSGTSAAEISPNSLFPAGSGRATPGLRGQRMEPVSSPTSSSWHRTGGLGSHSGALGALWVPEALCGGNPAWAVRVGAPSSPA